MKLLAIFYFNLSNMWWLRVSEYCQYSSMYSSVVYGNSAVLIYVISVHEF